MARAVLFDIDGTLLDSGGAGGAALGRALGDLFGVPSVPVPAHELAGATDLGISRRLHEAYGKAFDEASHERFVARYLEHLEEHLMDPAWAVRLLPGVSECLALLGADSEFVPGLLTGNVRRGAEVKLRRLGIHDAFLDGAFGDDAEDRNLLGPIALERLSARAGVSFRAEETVVIGDTPRDIACANAMGARCVAVATGVIALSELEVCGPWIVATDLEQVMADPRWMDWMANRC